MKFLKNITILIHIFLFIHCIGKSVRYIDPETSDGTPEWGPAEIHGTTETMVNSLYDHLNKKKKPSFLELEKVDNSSSEHIDTKILTNEIVSSLIKKEIIFVDKTKRSEAIKEIELAQKGLVRGDSEIKAGNLLSPNLKLSGEINDNVNYTDGKKQQYIVITMKLISLETGALEWQNEKKFLKVSKVEGYGW
jgi:PBP1b-binding outer membrane lipoprotein LpoB